MTEHGAMYRELEELFSSGEDFGELRNRAQCTRRYRIDEQIPGGRPAPGVEASYETWRTDLDEEDLEEGIRVLATD